MLLVRALLIRQKLVRRQPQHDLGLQSEPCRQTNDRIGYELQLAARRSRRVVALKEALTIRQKLADANPNVTEFQSNLSTTHNVMGWALNQTGKPAEALAAFERANTIMQKLADARSQDGHPVAEGTIVLLFDLLLGGMHIEIGRTTEAVVSLRRAVGTEAAVIAVTYESPTTLACSLRLARWPRGLAPARGLRQPRGEQSPTRPWNRSAAPSPPDTESLPSCGPTPTWTRCGRAVTSSS